MKILTRWANEGVVPIVKGVTLAGVVVVIASISSSSCTSNSSDWEGGANSSKVIKSPLGPSINSLGSSSQPIKSISSAWTSTGATIIDEEVDDDFVGVNKDWAKLMREYLIGRRCDFGGDSIRVGSWIGSENSNWRSQIQIISWCFISIKVPFE